MHLQSNGLTQELPRGTASEAIGAYWDAIIYGTVLCAILALFFARSNEALYQPMLAATEGHRWARLLLVPSLLWVWMGTILIVFRSLVWFRYKPFPKAAMDDAPFLTVIIPAYNEGAMVLQSIESVASATYPQDRLEIFVIDDGSKDDTWRHIERAVARYPKLVKPVRFSVNRGKRAALAVGFEKARGDVVVTLDSDSVIEPAALLAIAGPFRNPKVGAVAGKVAVYNRREGLLPRMLHVRYILSFDLLRAVESAYGTVYCCPGALSAYRTSAVRQVLSRWMAQTFLGSRCTYGEDRAMTNFILSCGYDTVYQRSAVVHTVVPAAYLKLCKMFLRWDRSYVREELRFLRLVWKRPLVPRFIALFDRFITNLRFPANYASLALLCVFAVEQPMVIVQFLIAIGMMSLFYMVYYLRSERSLDFVYGVVYSYFAVFALFWIFPYAMFTVRARSWLTR